MLTQEFEYLWTDTLPESESLQARCPIHAEHEWGFSLFRSLVRVDAVGGNFDFGNAAEGEQELYEVLGRLFRSLFHNVGDRVGDRGLEHL